MQTLSLPPWPSILLWIIHWFYREKKIFFLSNMNQKHWYFWLYIHVQLPFCRYIPRMASLCKLKPHENKVLTTTLTISNLAVTLPLSNVSLGCSGIFLTTEHISNWTQHRSEGSRRIVAGLCTWLCHVNVIHEKKKICQVFILPGYHQKVVNIQVFGHVQHSCNGFSLSAFQAGLCI